MLAVLKPGLSRTCLSQTGMNFSVSPSLSHRFIEHNNNQNNFDHPQHDLAKNTVPKIEGELNFVIFQEQVKRRFVTGVQPNDSDPFENGSVRQALLNGDKVCAESQETKNNDLTEQEVLLALNGEDTAWSKKKC